MDSNAVDLDVPCTLVLFGASGDLAKRKLIPALYHLFLAGQLPKRFRLLGYARTPLTVDAFRDLMRKSIREHATKEDAADPKLDAFLAQLDYMPGHYADKKDLERLAAKLGRDGGESVLYYLALPPGAAGELLERFAEGSLAAKGSRVLMEKPFGIDLESARRLNALLARSFDEPRIHRIDHYLAKDTVRNLLIFRFTNAIFEPIWNRHYIDHIQVSATETIGVEERGSFYDGVGVVRDMLQNHVLMLLALTTMEPPVAGDPESIRDRTRDLLASIETPAPGDFVFGQYRGYRQAKDVNPNSTTPTFAALRLRIGNWRWNDVPMYLVSGKCLDARVSEVSIVFKQIPVCLLDAESCGRLEPNMLTLRIHPNEGIRLSLGVKTPGYRDLVRPAAMNFRYADLGAEAPDDRIDAALGAFGADGHHLFTGYERVLLEALAGRSSLFWRADGIEAAWRVVEPLLRPENAPPAAAYPAYAPGTSATDIAMPLLSRDRRQWRGSNISGRAGAK